MGESRMTSSNVQFRQFWNGQGKYSSRYHSLKSMYLVLMEWYHGSEWRKPALTIVFLVFFLIAAARFTMIIFQDQDQPQIASSYHVNWSKRAPIVDRNDVLLATNISTYALFVNPNRIVGKDNKQRVFEKLINLFPDLDQTKLLNDLHQRVNFIWIKYRLTPEQVQAVHDMGEPGVYMGSRKTRVYPNGRIAAHILGNTTYGKQAAHSAEIIGQSGVEKSLDEFLRQPDINNSPLVLSIDSRVQAILAESLQASIDVFKATSGSATLMDVHNGEIIAMVSLPDFDPNDRSSFLSEDSGQDNPRFSKAVQGVFEFGSTFKVFAAAQAIDLDLVDIDSLIANTDFKISKYTIKRTEYGDEEMTVKSAIAKSSNAASARLALMIGAERQQQFLSDLGFFEPTQLELLEAKQAKPLFPERWTDLTLATVSYGHGIAVSQVHLAAAFSTLVNGGFKINPTILKDQNQNFNRPRVISQSTSNDVVEMLRSVVTDGTASAANFEGYSVGGKTGTAEKVNPKGGYFKDKVLATFASVFPTESPRYVLVVSLDDATSEDKTRWERSAGKTAVPTAKVIISRVAPLLGIRPSYMESEVTEE